MLVLQYFRKKMFLCLPIDVFSTCKQWETQANHSWKQSVHHIRYDFLWKSFNERLFSSHTVQPPPLEVLNDVLLLLIIVMILVFVLINKECVEKGSVMQVMAFEIRKHLLF